MSAGNWKYDPFRNEIVTLICEAFLELCNELKVEQELDRQQVAALLATPPDLNLGQAAFPCFSFAKVLRKAPPAIAQELVIRILNKTRKAISNAQAVQGYLNFFQNNEAVASSVFERLANSSFFSREKIPQEQIEKVVVEYSQPNTHKAMHVGHLRCLVLGDSVCRTMAYAGHDVVKTTYPGDLGAHIAKTLWYLQNRCKEQAPATGRADWLGDVYALADEAIKLDTGTEKETTNRAQIAEILKQLQNKSGPAYELWLETREWSLEQMRSIYSWLGVSFDQWFYESECDEPSRELVLKKFEEGFFVKDQGAIGIDLSDYKLGFALFLKSDGNGLYITKDLELLRRKFADPKVTSSLVVVDHRQKLHFQQVYKTAELIGYPQATQSATLLYETVNTPDGKPFSSRSMTGLRLLELRDAMEQKVTQDYLERYRGIWSDEEISRTAEAVTIGALKYGMLRVDNSTQVTFVLDEWLRLDGDTGPYLQYMHARCCNILEKQGHPEAGGAIQLDSFEEGALLFHLSRFNDFALQAAAQHRPCVVAGYLYDLAKTFNRFYENCPIRSSEGAVRNSRLQLVKVSAAVMKQGLELLGIPAPSKM
ncbi:MAG: arginine--tRNA ligase [Pseudomonadota bacterium]|jgi:arginyl-tRNA synthetase